MLFSVHTHKPFSLFALHYYTFLLLFVYTTFITLRICAQYVCVVVCTFDTSTFICIWSRRCFIFSLHFAFLYMWSEEKAKKRFLEVFERNECLYWYEIFFFSIDTYAIAWYRITLLIYTIDTNSFLIFFTNQTRNQINWK